MTVTRYEYDDAGRLVRSVAIPESEWSPEDVALLVASRRHEREIGPHGIPMSEAMDPANELKFQATKSPVIDWAEKTRKDTSDAYYEKWDAELGKPVNRNGHLWPVTKRD